MLAPLIEANRGAAHGHDVPSGLEPAPYYQCAPCAPCPPRPESAESATDDAARGRGVELLRAGKVAAFTVAGGQGTRLGWNGPKGTFPATPVTGKPLFRVFAEQILAAQKKYGARIHWYIMTSPLNDAATRSFLLDNNCFGLDRGDIIMFPQGVMPSFDADGRLLLAGPDTLALNPDGHGGSLRALAASGAIAQMQADGVEHISYFQVDNPLVHVLDPRFIGLHVGAPDSSAEMSSKMVAKAYPAEKVGVFCRANGKVQVVEYSDLPQDLAEARNADGTLRFNAGSVALHMIGVEFVARLTEDPHAFALPFHRADKKVPHYDLERSVMVEPDTPNGIKLETFVFDALTLAESSIVVETPREDEFAPIKNAHGSDSPATSHALQIDRAARWLEANGVTVPRTDDGTVDARIEISPLTALEPEDLQHAKLPASIERGAQVVL